MIINPPSLETLELLNSSIQVFPMMLRFFKSFQGCYFYDIGRNFSTADDVANFFALVQVQVEVRGRYYLFCVHLIVRTSKYLYSPCKLRADFRSAKRGNYPSVSGRFSPHSGETTQNFLYLQASTFQGACTGPRSFLKCQV